VLGQLLANLAVEMAKLHTKSRLQYIEISQVSKSSCDTILLVCPNILSGAKSTRPWSRCWKRVSPV